MDANADVLQTIQQLMNDILVWIGFGTVVGLLAKAIMPGRDPGGTIATMAMGVGGTIIGCGTLSFLVEGQRVTPISPMGFAVATGGAFIILAFYRLLAGYWFVEGEQHPILGCVSGLSPAVGGGTPRTLLTTSEPPENRRFCHGGPLTIPDASDKVGETSEAGAACEDGLG